MSEDERKLTVKRPDGTVLEIPITNEELAKILTNISGMTPHIVTTQQKHKGKTSDENLPSAEQLREFLKDGDKTVHEIAQHFLGRTINSHRDTSLYHKIYNLKARATRKSQ